MKRILSLIVAFLGLATFAQAQLTDGFYRVNNAKTGRYIYVVDNTGSVSNTGDIDYGALQLWKGLDRCISDPASVMYVQKVGDKYDIKAQGTGIHALTNRYVNLAKAPMGYQVYATEAGVSKYLRDNELSDADKGKLYDDGGNDSSTKIYTMWTATPLTSSSDNYFGVKANVAANGKYYQPFYAAFAFNMPAGMKAYAVSKVGYGMVVFKQITGTIPAATPVILECSSADATNNRLDLLLSGGTVPSGNLLKGTFFCVGFRPKSKDAYVPFNPSTTRVLGLTKDGKLGFVSANSPSITNISLTSGASVQAVTANHSYLTVEAGTAAELKIVSEEEYNNAIANWQYTITYTIDGKVVRTEKHKKGDALTAYTPEAKEGYTFSGWNTSLPATMPANDITLTGSYKVNSYTLTYMVDGVTYNTSKVNYGTSLAAIAAPTKEGYTFSGWQGLPATMPAKDVTVTGTFSINSYKVIYKVDGSVYQTITVKFGEALTAIAAPTKEGYTFSGWSQMPAKMPANDITVTGTFSINSYKLTYLLNGAGYKDEVFKQETLEFGAAITPQREPLSKSGYTFSGWSEIPATMPACDVNIYGTYVGNVHHIYYTVNNDKDTVSIQDVCYGDPIQVIEVPAREGHKFEWVTDLNTLPATMPDNDLTIRGKYTVLSYTLSFVLNGAGYNNEVVKSNNVKYGATIPSAYVYTAKEKEGYSFAWDEKVPETMPGHDVTITGTYTPRVYTVTYYYNNEIVHVDSVLFGQPIPAYTYVPEPTDGNIYTFVGWRGTTYKTMPAKDITYTAIVNVTDGIQSLNASEDGGQAYDLSGRRVSVRKDNRNKRVYIINGRKVLR